MSSATSKSSAKKIKKLKLSEIEKISQERKQAKARKKAQKKAKGVKPTKTSSTKKVKKTPKKRFRPVKLLVMLGFALLIILIPLSVPAFLFLKDLPSPSKLQSQSFPVSTIIMDRNGTELYEIYGDTNRKPVTLEQIP